jgi:NADPH:quinone reductase-like Zn-dependent oxidoreductase
MVLPAKGLFPLPAAADPRQLSMLGINQPTAALLSSEYVDLQPGDWVVPNAANSGVGRSVIADDQLCSPSGTCRGAQGRRR